MFILFIIFILKIQNVVCFNNTLTINYNIKGLLWYYGYSNVYCKCIEWNNILHYYLLLFTKSRLVHKLLLCHFHFRT